MASAAFDREGDDPDGHRLCPMGNMIMAALNDGGSQAKQLASLLEVLTDHLDGAPERIDPIRTAQLAADVSRIAQDWSFRMSGRMFTAEGQCCMSRLHPSAPA